MLGYEGLFVLQDPPPSHEEKELTTLLCKHFIV